MLSGWFAWPLLSTSVLPLHDLPNHLARISALHHLNDPRWNLSRFYARSVGLVPYLGHFYVVHLLAYVFGVVRANLLYLVAYVVGAPLCGVVYARATGRSPWLALLILPLAVGYFFQWGFVSFCVGMVLMLPASALCYRTLDEPSPRRALGLFAITSALYFCHVVPWAAFGVYVMVLLGFELAARRWRSAAWTAGATGASLVWFLFGMLRASSIGYFHHSGLHVERDSPARLIRRSAQLIDLFANQTVEEWIYVILALAVLALVITDAGRSDEPVRVRARVPLAVALMLLCALLLPFAIHEPISWWMINLRFVGLAAMFALFLPRGPIVEARALVLVVAVAASLILPVRMAHAWREFSDRVEPLVRLIQTTPMGSATLLLHAPPPRVFTDPALMPDAAVWRELYNLPLVYRGGFSPYLYDDGFPVRKIASLPAPLVESAGVHATDSQKHFDPDVMSKGWDYLITRTADAPAVLPPDGVIREGIQGEWSLYKNLRKD